MKRNLKHYRQVASTVLITTLLMVPSLGPLTSLADNPDDGVVYEDIIDDADDGYYDEEDTVVYSRAARASGSDAVSVDSLCLTAPAEKVDAGTTGFSIAGSVTLASGSNWTDGLASSSNATSKDTITDNIQLSIPKGLFVTAPEKVSDVTVNGTTATFKIAGDIAADASGDYMVGASWGSVKAEGVTVTVIPKKTELKEVTLMFTDQELQLQAGTSKDVTMEFKPDAIWDKVTVNSSNEEAVKVSRGKNGVLTLEGVKVTEEPVIVTAAFEENEEYKGAEATLSVTVTAEPPVEEGAVTLSIEGGDLILDPEETGTATIIAKVEGSFPTEKDVLAGIQMENNAADVAEAEFDPNTGKVTVKGLKAGMVSITFSYENSKGESEVTLNVKVVETSETVKPLEVETKGAEVDVAGAAIDGGKAPEGVTDEEHKANVEKIKDEVKDSLEKNTNVKNGFQLIINNNQNLADFGVREPGGTIYPLQKLESMSMGYDQGKPVLKSMKFDISLYWRPEGFDASSTGAKLKKDIKGSFKFRIPVPESVGNVRYANVNHDGKWLSQSVIQKENGGWYITVKVNSFSPFTVEFTDTKKSSGSSGGGGGSSSGRSTTTTTNTEPDTMFGSWQQDEQGWRFMQNNGAYAANAWGRINGFWYYFGENTYMMTGWIFVGEQWYYLSQTPETIGKMQTGPIYDAATDRWFHADASGAIQTGWQYIEDSWRYLDPASEGVRGAMVTNQWVDGRYLDAQGRWTE